MHFTYRFSVSKKDILGAISFCRRWGVAKGSFISWVAKLKADKNSECKLSNGWSRSYREIHQKRTASFCRKISDREVTGRYISIPIFHGTLSPIEFWTPPRVLQTCGPNLIILRSREQATPGRLGLLGRCDLLRQGWQCNVVWDSLALHHEFRVDTEHKTGRRFHRRNGSDPMSPLEV